MTQITLINMLKAHNEKTVLCVRQMDNVNRKELERVS